MSSTDGTKPKSDPLQDPESKAIIDKVIAENKDRPGATMVVLNQIQSQIGYIAPTVQSYVAAEMNIPASVVHGVVTFYSFFTTTPRGRHTIKFCLGTACYVGGIPQIIEKAKQILEIEPGETTEDGMITLELCRCVGACSQAPVITVDDEIHGRMSPNKFPKIIRQIKKMDEEALKEKAA